MAPNLSGIRVRDQAEAIGLLEIALELAQSMLRQGTSGGKAAGQQGRAPNGNAGGAFVAKLFQGAGSDQWLADVRKLFATVRIVKPKASREESREVYVVAQGLKWQPAMGMGGLEEQDESQLG